MICTHGGASTLRKATAITRFRRVTGVACPTASSGRGAGTEHADILPTALIIIEATSGDIGLALADTRLAEHSATTIARVFAAPRRARTALLIHAASKDLAASQRSAAAAVIGTCSSGILAHDLHHAAAIHAAPPFTALAVDDAGLAHLLTGTNALFTEHPPRTFERVFTGFPRAICAPQIEGCRLAETGIATAITRHALVTEAGTATRAKEKIAAEIAFTSKPRPTTELPLHATFEADHIGDGLDTDAHIGEEGLTDRSEGADFSGATRLAVAATLRAHGSGSGAFFAHAVRTARGGDAGVVWRAAGIPDTAAAIGGLAHPFEA